MCVPTALVEIASKFCVRSYAGIQPQISPIHYSIRCSQELDDRTDDRKSTFDLLPRVSWCNVR